MSSACLEAYDSFIQKIAEKSALNRIPCFGMIELTYRCNLDCVHCYLSNIHNTPEMKYEEVTRIIDEAAREGCISLLLTGGEPFVREDFLDIFLYAKQKGMILYLFTNAVSIPEEAFQLFKSYKPRVIDISLYGASEEAYQRTTGRPVFKRVMTNIQRLIDLGLNVKVKTTLLQTNVEDLPQCVGIMNNLHLAMRMNTVMMYTYDNSAKPAQYRLSPEEIVELEAGNEQVSRQWRYSFKAKPLATEDSRLYRCGAGYNSFCVTADARMKMCATVQKHWADLRQVSFHDAWEHLVDPMKNLKMKEDHRCRKCELASWCSQCPAWADLEMGDESAVVPQLCELTHLRAERFFSRDCYPE